MYVYGRPEWEKTRVVGLAQASGCLGASPQLPGGPQVGVFPVAKRGGSFSTWGNHTHLIRGCTVVVLLYQDCPFCRHVGTGSPGPYYYFSTSAFNAPGQRCLAFVHLWGSCSEHSLGAFTDVRVVVW